MRKAFTLIEVNLAMLIMAGGILTVVGLYSLGFRENRQSQEDVDGAAIADAFISPLVMAISATNVQWSSFKGEFTFPSQGWRSYMDGNYEVSADPTPKAKQAFSSLISKMTSGMKGSKPNFNMSEIDDARGESKCALVVHHDEGSAVVSIAFRVTKKPNALMSQPLYFTEARFQGVQE